MSLRLLDLLFKIGHYLSLTPKSIEDFSIGPLGKVYGILLLLLLAVGVVISTIFKGFYSHFIPIKIIVNVMNDIALYCFCCYTILSVTFWNRSNWKQLIVNFQSTNGVLTPVNTNSYGKLLILVNMMYLALTAYSFYVWCSLFGWDYVKQSTVEQIQLYILFFYTFLLLVVLKICLGRYKAITGLLTKQLERVRMEVVFVKMQDEEFLGVLNRMGFVVVAMKEAVDIFNEIFGATIFLMIMYSSLLFLNYLDFTLMASDRYDHEDVYKILISDIALVLVIFFEMSGLLMMCDLILKEAEQVPTLCYLLLRFFKSDPIAGKLQELITFILENLPQFSATRFFDIDRSTILSVLATIITFLIIIIQFHETAEADN